MSTFTHKSQEWGDDNGYRYINEQLEDLKPDPLMLHPGSWQCEWCDSLEHADREPYRSIYYSRHVGNGEMEGPTFCSDFCLYNWKKHNESLTMGARVRQFKRVVPVSNE
jgi:hypothetical protein